MSIINFENTDCAHCYKCVRNCEVKAIRVEKGQAQIMQDTCIYCGHCIEICPQSAKTLNTDLDKIKFMIARGDRVIASLDPSYRGLLKYDHRGQLVTALKKLGFFEVRETAEGASYISEEYVRLMNEGKMENIISTNCPGIVYLVERHYPMLIPYLAPVISPMIAHGRMIKQYYGYDTKVVFIGPCVAKKEEAEEDIRTKGAVDAVLQFNELIGWFAERNIEIDECEETPFGNPNPEVNRLYPVSNGVIRSIEAYGAPSTYKRLMVSGVGSCRELLHSMKRGYIKNCFIELNLCNGGCVNGPGVDKKRGFRFQAVMNIENSAVLNKPQVELSLPNALIERNYFPSQVLDKMPTEEELKEILKTIGRSNSDTEFNCGACGYMTCREKAIAIYQGKAESDMCLIRSYERARSQASIVMEATPNIILVADREFRIREFNRKAQKVFNTSREEALKMYVFDFIDIDDYEKVYQTHEPLNRVKRKWPQYGMTVRITARYIASMDWVLAIIEDITEENIKTEKQMDKKLSAIQMAQAVIDKQMTAAQEIAGLLGETTAETKAILTKIQDIMLEDEDEIRSED